MDQPKKRDPRRRHVGCFEDARIRSGDDLHPQIGAGIAGEGSNRRKHCQKHPKTWCLKHDFNMAYCKS